MAQVVKKPSCNAGDLGSILGLGSPGEGNGNPLQYSCLKNPMDRGAWRATVGSGCVFHPTLSSFTPLISLILILSALAGVNCVFSTFLFPVDSRLARRTCHQGLLSRRGGEGYYLHSSRTMALVSPGCSWGLVGLLRR